MGRIASTSVSKKLLDKAIESYVKYYGVDLSEAEIPLEGFANFDAFFTRRLRPGARPIHAGENIICSAADGRIEALGQVQPDATFAVKGNLYSLKELLLENSYLSLFENGSYCVIYLSPASYHRVHTPVQGKVTSIHHAPGRLFPVNSIGLNHVPGLFARNERIAVYQETPNAGTVATVFVGAFGVGRIRLSFEPGLETNYKKEWGHKNYGGFGVTLEKGDELGVFHLGSTIILFFEKNVPLEWAATVSDSVRVGQALARVGVAP